MPAQIIGIILAISAAASWGSGDFCGGYAARRLNQYQVLLLTSLSSLSLLLVLALIWGEGLPPQSSLIFASVAGISGALGLAALYRGLSIGDSAIVAPVAGVIGTIIPVIAGMLVQGFPGYVSLAGFTLALLGIWLVTRQVDDGGDQISVSLGLAVLAGIGFGGFLTLIAQVDGNQVFSPLVIAKLASVLLASILIWRTGQPVPTIIGSKIGLISGLLDAGGNLGYLFATHFTRLDIAAVLSSLYPAGTVLLSTFILKEVITWKQWLGVGTCIAAIVLITIG